MDKIDKVYQQIMLHAGKFRSESYSCDPLTEIQLYDYYNALSNKEFQSLDEYEKIELCVRYPLMYEHFEDQLTDEEQSAVTIMR